MASAFFSSLAVVIVALTLVSSVMSADLGKAVRRDTDQTSELREKLHKLHSLLSDFYADESGEKAPEAKTSDPKVKAEKVTEDQSEDSKELDALKSQIVSSQEEVAQSPPPEKSNLDEQSLKVLARAIANYRRPKFDREDSTGEYLGTQYNDVQDGVEAEKERKIQALIARALAKLRSPEAYEKRIPQNYQGGFEEGSFGDFVDERPEEPVSQIASSSRVGTYHSDAIKAIELRLMRDLQLANTLGVSVDELIQDLESKAYREAEIREVERRLATLDLKSRQ